MSDDKKDRSGAEVALTVILMLFSGGVGDIVASLVPNIHGVWISVSCAVFVGLLILWAWLETKGK
jgi:hypothetical protein